MWYRTANDLLSVGAEPGDYALLQLHERGHVQIALVIEQSDAAPDNCPTVGERHKGKSDSGRKVVFACYIVAVIAHTVLDGEPFTNAPLVLKTRKILSFI